MIDFQTFVKLSIWPSAHKSRWNFMTSSSLGRRSMTRSIDKEGVDGGSRRVKMKSADVENESCVPASSEPQASLLYRARWGG